MDKLKGLKDELAIIWKMCEDLKEELNMSCETNINCLSCNNVYFDQSSNKFKCWNMRYIPIDIKVKSCSDYEYNSKWIKDIKNVERFKL